MAKLVLDLHDIYNKGDQIDRALDQVIQDAIDKKSVSWRSSLARGRAR